jgi:hypothetical protein
LQKKHNFSGGYYSKFLITALKTILGISIVNESATSGRKTKFTLYLVCINLKYIQIIVVMKTVLDFYRFLIDRIYL